jgi:hypothetical protein
LAFGGKRTVDLPPIMRNAVLRYFTMFNGWANAQLNLFLGSVGEGRAQWSEGMKTRAIWTVTSMFAALAAQQVASAALVGNVPEDYNGDGKVDGNDVGRWAAVEGLFAVPSYTPLGSVVRSAKGQQSRDPSFTPWMNLLNVAARTAGKTSSLVAGEAAGTADEDQELATFIAWLELGGAATGVPQQAITAARYWASPDRNPQAPVEQDIFGTAFGPKKAEKIEAAIGQ